MAKEYIYSYQNGDGKNKQLLGGKGANLCEMTQIGLNVPPGFVVSTEACIAYMDNPERQLPARLLKTTEKHIKVRKTLTGKTFGGPSNPFLVSMRSGAAMSMPGMMDTILNLGLNRNMPTGLIDKTNSLRSGYDAYRQYMQIFGKMALDSQDEEFEIIENRVIFKDDIDLISEHLKEIGEALLHNIQKYTDYPCLDDVSEQLEVFIKAIPDLWMEKGTQYYRRKLKIPQTMGNGTGNIDTEVFFNKKFEDVSGITTAFCHYLSPLIYKEDDPPRTYGLPHHVKLKNVAVSKKNFTGIGLTSVHLNRHH